MHLLGKTWMPAANRCLFRKSVIFTATTAAGLTDKRTETRQEEQAYVHAPKVQVSINQLNGN